MTSEILAALPDVIPTAEGYAAERPDGPACLPQGITLPQGD